ncbi:MAG: HAD family hydrolase [Bacteroidales bacterium]|nr:HAD family hydrolase [Bacteroidales bacterium]
MKYKLVIFDLDGTLLDTLEDLGTAVNYALKSKGFPLHTMEEYPLMVGHGVRNLVTSALPEDRRSEEQIDESLAAFKSYYTSHIDVYTQPYPGMTELVAKLDAAAVRLAVASNKFQSGTEYLVRKFFGGIPFVAILGNREGFPLKPDPEIVAEVLRKANTTREQAVMVGDSPTDMKTAANGGIRGIAVNWGYRDMTGESTVSSAEELLTLL